MSERVLIVGGGIAGMSTAIALRQKSSGMIDVDVAETSGAAEGAMIALHNQSVTALREIGVYDALAQICALSYVKDMQTYGPDGSALPANLAAVPDDFDHAVALGLFVQRPQLAAVLRDAAEEVGVALLPVGITVHTVESNDSDGALVGFTDGTRGSYDLIVAADGIRSTVRDIVFEGEYAPEFAGELSIRWTFDAQGLDLVGGFHISRTGSFMMARPAANVGYLNCTLPSPGSRSLTEAEARAHLKSVLSGFENPDVQALATRLDGDATVICRAFESVWIDEPWYRGSIVVIGDAAHATSAHLGAGGGMALEDGVVLAEELVAASCKAAGLQRFHSRRRERVRDVVTTSLRLLEIEAAGEWGSPASGRLYAEAIGRLRMPY